ncbi:MAG: hypothetical protein WC377_06705 [Bacteroidales bacterium]|jgi:hypothetical protein|nr:hypothetical protein [Bacteroidales bacterium]MDD2823765.1 hypothetical protein [Bacteroidales bacterium]MDD3100584.1 hypothetical protein [Bacteroidales bacterium]MDD3639884.1 hypothetical protein [Bacteroidales bacterium]MDD3944151.1 hypothetical protein [Bacteroidales bacterium]
MTNSDIRPARKQIIEGLNVKSHLKNKVFLQTLDAFNLTKEVLHEMSNDVNELLKDGENRRVRFEYRDRGKYEAELKFADDILLFSMHTDVFQFDRDHPVWKNEYVKKEPFSTYCGVISAYNFLTDSFKYNRKDDLGYLVARLFINKDKSYFTEGKRQMTRELSEFGKRIIDKTAIINVVETAVLYSLAFDLLAPPYETVAVATVEQMNAKIDSSKMQTGKRLGFAFCADDVKADHE